VPNANHRIARADGVKNFRRRRQKGHDPHQRECSPAFGATQSVGMPTHPAVIPRAARLGGPEESAFRLYGWAYRFSLLGARISCLEIGRRFILFDAVKNHSPADVRLNPRMQQNGLAARTFGIESLISFLWPAR